jgi:hypothetical protein
MAKKLKLMEILTDVEIQSLKEVAGLSISDDPNKDDEIRNIFWDRVVGVSVRDAFALDQADSFGTGEAFTRNVASLCKIGRMSEYRTGRDGKTMTYSVVDTGVLGGQEHNPLMEARAVGNLQSKHAYFIDQNDAKQYMQYLKEMIDKSRERSKNPTLQVEFTVRENSK